MPKNPGREGSPRLITPQQIEQEHGIKRSTLYTYRHRPSFPRPVKVEGSIKTFYRADEVAAWLAANPKEQGKRTDVLAKKQQGESAMTEQASLISEPTPSNDRGFLLYGGREIPTDYGHTVRVQESSAAEGPHVWLYISDSPQMKKNNPHLSLEQAVAVHAALGQFIESVPERWEGGAELLAEAKRHALGVGDGIGEEAEASDG